MSRAEQMPTPLLPAQGLRGPVPWMVAVMTMLAMLALAGALALTPAARSLSGQIVDRVSIQIPIADPLQRRMAVRQLRENLTDAPYVRDVRVLSESELRAMADQWLGDVGEDAALTLPAIIDVDLVSADGYDRLVRDVRQISADAEVVPHATYLGPVASLMRSLGWIAAAIALLTALVAGAIAVLSARSRLEGERDTIDILHLVGATDVQIARMFQRQVARDTIWGVTIGGGTGLLLTLLLFWQLRGVASGLAAGGSAWSMLLLLLIPPIIFAIAVFSARRAVLHALGNML